MEWFVYSTLTHGSDLKGYILGILSTVNLIRSRAGFSCGGDDA